MHDCLVGLAAVRPRTFQSSLHYYFGHGYSAAPFDVSIQVVETKGSLLGMGNAVGLAVWLVILAQAGQAIDPPQLWEEHSARIKGTSRHADFLPNFQLDCEENILNRIDPPF